MLCHALCGSRCHFGLYSTTLSRFVFFFSVTLPPPLQSLQVFPFFFSWCSSGVAGSFRALAGFCGALEGLLWRSCGGRFLPGIHSFHARNKHVLQCKFNAHYFHIPSRIPPLRGFPCGLLCFGVFFLTLFLVSPCGLQVFPVFFWELLFVVVVSRIPRTTWSKMSPSPRSSPRSWDSPYCHFGEEEWTEMHERAKICAERHE